MYLCVFTFIHRNFIVKNIKLNKVFTREYTSEYTSTVGTFFEISPINIFSVLICIILFTNNFIFVTGKGRSYS